ncbi:AbiH family protein [Flavobacterium sp. GT3R68]|uniref:AbiH family protein n=1 Tax=Flavobacterium sp. GT3R68 TaxID=2594437 RepID=UPI000F863055|nr:AbiH family protein [Flavobacterium sp. GT3R68]RTY87999.1 hypothetical protein EKL32_25455 [Flavobacterium sp. GSN2]TRW91158.1 hypothetical protein FNW07_10070 [Flavobacterium sp. GT3R68]
MPKILITGNGFDLNIGLPTSYNDFIKILSFVDGHHSFDFETVYSKSANHESIVSKFNSFEFDTKNIESLKHLIGKNQWFRFFKNEYEIETWIDFENKIEYVLKNLFASLEFIKDSAFSKGSLLENEIYYGSDLFKNNIEIMEVLSKFEIISLDNHRNITLNTKFLISKYGYFIDIDLDKITKNLLSELYVFKKIFNYYFEIFVIPLYEKSKSKSYPFFSKINKHYTFNYTPTFEKIYGNKQITKFLHGKINSVENKIVLGINEIPKNESLEKRHFLPFTKYFQKLNNNTDYIFIKEFETKVNNNYSFFFWGHSLDKSDEDYLNEVFDFVNELKTKTKKIIIIYHNEKAKSVLLLNILNVRGKKDIQDLMRSQVLQFLHIESKELQNELNRDISSRPIGIATYSI